MAGKFKPNILAEITFFNEEDGGRVVRAQTPSCLLTHKGLLWDCKLFLNGEPPVYPGETRTLPV